MKAYYNQEKIASSFRNFFKKVSGRPYSKVRTTMGGAVYE